MNRSLVKITKRNFKFFVLYAIWDIKLKTGIKYIEKNYTRNVYVYVNKYKNAFKPNLSLIYYFYQSRKIYFKVSSTYLRNNRNCLLPLSIVQSKTGYAWTTHRPLFVEFMCIIWKINFYLLSLHFILYYNCDCMKII